jgi:hypothetical protein
MTPIQLRELAAKIDADPEMTKHTAEAADALRDVADQKERDAGITKFAAEILKMLTAAWVDLDGWELEEMAAKHGLMRLRQGEHVLTDAGRDLLRKLEAK